MSHKSTEIVTWGTFALGCLIAMKAKRKWIGFLLAGVSAAILAVLIFGSDKDAATVSTTGNNSPAVNATTMGADSPVSVTINNGSASLKQAADLLHKGLNAYATDWESTTKTDEIGFVLLSSGVGVQKEWDSVWLPHIKDVRDELFKEGKSSPFLDHVIATPQSPKYVREVAAEVLRLSGEH